MTSISNVALRPLNTGDFKTYYRLISNPSIAKGARFQSVQDKPKAQRWLKADLKNDRYYAITLNKQMIGMLSLYATIGQQGRPDLHHLELAYMILPNEQGHGYMTYALGLLIKDLKLNSSIQQLLALVSEDNLASRKVLLKNRFHNYHSVLDMFSGREDLVYGLNLNK